MKVVIVNKSDSTGGAAVVSRRLMEALRREGVDARMLVCEKLTDSPFIELAAKPSTIKRKFFLERLKILLANGFSRDTLFKIDTGEKGLSLWRHPLIKEADAIMLNWVNQGMLSLKGVTKILELEKPVIWTMHDMWCMTGICHHAGNCNHFFEECGDCPLLGVKSRAKDLSNQIWRKKQKIYSNRKLTRKMAFVAVSTWLKNKSLESSLLKKSYLEVIPNAFPIVKENIKKPAVKEKIRLLFGAARLDDPIKGLDTLKEATILLRQEYPGVADKLELALFGNIKVTSELEGFALPLIMLGVLRGENEIQKAYETSDILVSASSYETLPGTLVEAQAYGCIPVSFNQGGQSDIINGDEIGVLTEYSDNKTERARNLAEGILKAVTLIENTERFATSLFKMRQNVEDKFSYSIIAQKYITLIQNLKAID